MLDSYNTPQSASNKVLGSLMKPACSVPTGQGRPKFQQQFQSNRHKAKENEERLELNVKWEFFFFKKYEISTYSSIFLTNYLWKIYVILTFQGAIADNIAVHKRMFRRGKLKYLRRMLLHCVCNNLFINVSI